jgi:ArsR family transcriptional regulator, arsenate/arsenite/antimonite-responsive transcriptional repressor
VTTDRVFDALASAARRRVLRELSQSERTTSELALSLGVSAPAASRHLSVLEHAGIVVSRREGQRVVYGLVRDTLVEALAGFAAELAAGAAPPRARKPREAI